MSEYTFLETKITVDGSSDSKLCTQVYPTLEKALEANGKWSSLSAKLIKRTISPAIFALLGIFSI